jgi:hypothetical protein
MDSRSVRHPAALRVGLGVLAAGYTAIGGWALLAPSSFFTDFPAPGLGWVAGLPPYNQHLLTDFGAAVLGLACVLWLAAVVVERRLAQVALVALLVQAVPHLGFHLVHPGALPAGQVAASRFALLVPVVLALALLWLTARRGLDATGVTGKAAVSGSDR